MRIEKVDDIQRVVRSEAHELIRKFSESGLEKAEVLDFGIDARRTRSRLINCAARYFPEVKVVKRCDRIFLTRRKLKENENTSQTE